jgi:hypothetical protein
MRCDLPPCPICTFIMWCLTTGATSPLITDIMDDAQLQKMPRTTIFVLQNPPLMKGRGHWTDWSGNSGLTPWNEVGPHNWELNGTEFRAWVSRFRVPFRGRMKEVDVVHIRTREGSGRRGHPALQEKTSSVN